MVHNDRRIKQDTLAMLTDEEIEELVLCRVGKRDKRTDSREDFAAETYVAVWNCHYNA
jgi:hypothetical protein